MSENEGLDVLERRLLLELREIELKLSELQRENETLQRLLMSVRRKNPVTMRTDVTRKNSVRRVLLESVVLEHLKSAKGVPRKTHELLREVQIVDERTKSTTFRSMLHRLKNRGVLSSPKDGVWELVSKEAGS